MFLLPFCTHSCFTNQNLDDVTTAFETVNIIYLTGVVVTIFDHYEGDV